MLINSKFQFYLIILNFFIPPAFAGSKGYDIKISYNDPYIMKIPKTRKYNLNLKSIEINKKNLNFFDAVVLITDHDIYNYNFIKHNSKILIDCRGRYKPTTNIIRA